MARTEVTPVALTNDVAPGTGTTIDATLVTAGVTIPCSGQAESLLLRIENTAGADKIVTIPASSIELGDGGAAFRKGKGSLAVTVAATSGVKYVAGLETARFIQTHDTTSATTMAKGGHIHVDFATGTTGKLYAYTLPVKV